MLATSVARRQVRTILLLHACLLATLVASIVLSYLINHGLQWMIGHESGISSRFVSPGRFIDSPWAVIQKVLQQYWAVYGGKRMIYGDRYVTFPVLLLLGMIALAARAPHRGWPAAVFVVLYMLGMTLIPFAIHLISGGRLPYRSLVSVPYVFWFFAAVLVLSHIGWLRRVDRKSTRLNSSHSQISYAVFCLKKKIRNIVI